MVAIYVASVKRGAGKTAVGAGLGKLLLNDGKKVGFFKPLVAEIETESADSDVAFMRHVLALEEPIDILGPVISDGDNLASGVKKAYDKVAQGKDVVIIEDTGRPHWASVKIVEALEAKVIVVAGYADRLSVSKLGSSGGEWGEYLLGGVLNKVPGSQLGQVADEAAKSGMNILGVLPEDRALFALTVGELAEYIHGEILNSVEKSDELVENIMLGAMTVDPGPLYFGRKANKAVIVRDERSDMQLAALETPTKCLVISGDTPPISPVAYSAESSQVPIILTRRDVAGTVTNIENALRQTRFNQELKLPRLMELMGQHFNFKAVYQGLGLTK